MVGVFGLGQPPVAKRRVFFSFHYQNDIWKVNQVRQSWRRNKEQTREASGFYDASIWERSKLEGEEGLKRLIRDGMANTSVTCVLIGEQTYARRWVRYEMARSIVKGNGILGVHIDLMGDREGYATPRGPNPFDYMGVYLSNGSILLAEKVGGKWVRYKDYTRSVDLPRGWRQPHDKTVIKLSEYADLYCYREQKGGENFGAWVRNAAADAGR